MLTNSIRVLHYNGSTLTDYSLEMSELTATTIALATTHYLYIGQSYPFNNVFLNVDTVNSNASVLSVEYWADSQWRSGVDVLDGTKTSGVTLAKSGVVQFSVDDEYMWNMVTDTSETSGNPSELTGVEIYNLYWLRLKVSANLSAGTKLKNISYLFCNNNQLSIIDPEINNYLVSWGGASKLNWNDQIKLASEHIVSYMRKNGMIKHSGNILKFDDVSNATAYKTLSIIYSKFGTPYADKVAIYEKEFQNFMSIQQFNGLDVNNDGLSSYGEDLYQTSKVIR